MIKIKRISNEEDIHYFKLELSEDIHNQLINFFHSLGFPSDETLKIDTPFSELDSEYIYLHGKFKVHLFIVENAVNMVIDSKLTQKELTEMMRQHFIFPS